MTIFSALPDNLTNGTTADATQVMANLNQIINNGNANCAENGANSSITSLSGLSTPLSKAQGGTGSSTGQITGFAGIDNTPIGAATPAAGTFTNVVATTGDFELARTSAAFGYITRPNSAGHKSVGFSVSGGGDLDLVAHTTAQFQLSYSSITYFSVDNTGINSTAIGATTPSTGKFTTLSASGAATFSGTTTAPTVATSDSSTNAATTAFVKNATIAGASLNDVTASRAFGSTYTNSTGRPMVVMAVGNAGANGNFILAINAKQANASPASGAGVAGGVCGIVPNGATYSISAPTSSTVTSWLELS